MDDYTDEWRRILTPRFEELRQAYNPDQHESLKIFHLDGHGRPGGLLLNTWGALVPAFLGKFIDDAREKLISQLSNQNPNDVTFTHFEWTNRVAEP